MDVSGNGMQRTTSDMLTFAAASAHCTDRSGRLPTRDEVKGLATAAQGLGFDGELEVWTSSVCSGVYFLLSCSHLFYIL